MASWILCVESFQSKLPPLIVFPTFFDAGNLKLGMRQATYLLTIRGTLYTLLLRCKFHIYEIYFKTVGEKVDLPTYRYEDLDIYRVAYLHAQGVKQNVIARLLGLSKPKVNRLLKEAYRRGILEIRLNPPYQKVLWLAERLKALSHLKEAVVIPWPNHEPEKVLSMVGQMAAKYLVEELRDRPVTIAIGGGRTLYETIVNVDPGYSLKGVRIVPALGGAQGEHDTAVNYLAAELARRLGAQFFQLLVPAFCSSATEREMLIQMPQIRNVLEIARQADLLFFTVGAITPEVSSFHKFTRIPTEALQKIIEQEKGVAEILAQVIDEQGQPCGLKFAQRVVGLTLEEVRVIPRKIAVAALEHKVKPLAAALRGGFLDVLITDEATAKGVVKELQKGKLEEEVTSM